MTARLAPPLDAPPPGARMSAVAACWLVVAVFCAGFAVYEYAESQQVMPYVHTLSADACPGSADPGDCLLRVSDIDIHDERLPRTSNDARYLSLLMAALAVGCAFIGVRSWRRPSASPRRSSALPSALNSRIVRFYVAYLLPLTAIAFAIGSVFIFRAEPEGGTTGYVISQTSNHCQLTVADKPGGAPQAVVAVSRFGDPCADYQYNQSVTYEEDEYGRSSIVTDDTTSYAWLFVIASALFTALSIWYWTLLRRWKAAPELVRRPVTTLLPWEDPVARSGSISERRWPAPVTAESYDGAEMSPASEPRRRRGEVTRFVTTRRQVKNQLWIVLAAAIVLPSAWTSIGLLDHDALPFLATTGAIMALFLLWAVGGALHNRKEQRAGDDLIELIVALDGVTTAGGLDVGWEELESLALEGVESWRKTISLSATITVRDPDRVLGRATTPVQRRRLNRRTGKIYIGLGSFPTAEARHRVEAIRDACASRKVRFYYRERLPNMPITI